MLYKRGCVEVGHFSVQRIGVFWGKKLNNLLCWICLRDNFLHIGSTLDNMSTLWGSVKLGLDLLIVSI